MGGKLVFWLPTPSDLSEDEARQMLSSLEAKSKEQMGMSRKDAEGNHSLRLEAMTESPLHRSLSRWLCVYTKTEQSL